jgi:light-regulated signal transduction histidine kinase (bacteriophytochrome)
MEVASNLLNQACLEFQACAGIDALIAQPAQDAGALLIEEEGLTAGAMEKLIGFLGGQPPWSHLPVVLLVKRISSTGPRRHWSLWIHNLILVDRPVTSTALTSVFQMALKARQRQYEIRDLLASLQEMNRTLEQRVVERTAELERSNKDLEQFAYVASHDLQEPLRMVTGFLDLLRIKFKDKIDPLAQGYIAYAFDGATRMSTMMKDLLTYARAGGQDIKPEPLDLQGVLEYVKANLKTSIEESKAAITADPLPTVTADASQMRQVFQNLLANALKFRADDRPPEIHIGVAKKDGMWVIQVRDNGIGIDPKQVNRVFVVFQKLHSRQKYAGSGIGLAICKKIVERHGGRICVESTVGVGSMFYFTLPISAKNDA